MASAIKKCRVCGKEYEACRSANRSAGVFRWQEVACSPECGAVYLQKVEESRGHTAPKRERRRKAIEYIPVECPPTEEILKDIEELEVEIHKNLVELRKMLEENDD